MRPLNEAQERIEEALKRFQELANEPFAWGENDCCLAVADVIAAAHGRDPMAAFRGRYGSAFGAKRAIAREGFSDLAEAVEAAALFHGMVEAEPDAFEAGDFALGLAPLAGGGVMPVFSHDGWWHGRTHDGIVALAANGVARVWVFALAPEELPWR